MVSSNTLFPPVQSSYLSLRSLGQREYNWNAKVSFAMDVTECGELLAMDRTKTIEFLHDPGMGGADAGKVTKKIRIQPTQDSKGKTIFLSLYTLCALIVFSPLLRCLCLCLSYRQSTKHC